MKKFVLWVVSVMTLSVAVAGNWGFAPQDKSVAVNISDKSEHYRFIAYGTPFSIPADHLYKMDNGSPMPMVEYTKRAGSMAAINKQSWTALLNGLPSDYRRQMLADNGLNTGILIDDEVSLKIFMGQSVVYDLAPQGEKIEFDGYNTVTGGLAPITRSAHMLPAGPEGGFWLLVSGYEPLFVRSAYCANNVSVTWARAHVRQKMTTKTIDLPSDDHSGDFDPTTLNGNNLLENKNPGLDLTSFLLGGQEMKGFEKGLDKGASIMKEGVELGASLKGDCCDETTTSKKPGGSDLGSEWDDYTTYEPTPRKKITHVYEEDYSADNTSVTNNSLSETDPRVLRNLRATTVGVWVAPLIHDGIRYGFRQLLSRCGIRGNRPLGPTVPNNPSGPGNCYLYTYESGRQQWICPSNGQVGNPGGGIFTGGQTGNPGGFVGNPGGFAPNGVNSTSLFQRQRQLGVNQFSQRRGGGFLSQFLGLGGF